MTPAIFFIIATALFAAGGYLIKTESLREYMWALSASMALCALYELVNPHV